MKRFIKLFIYSTLVVLVLSTAQFVYAQITVTEPGGGDLWLIGDSVTVAWSSSPSILHVNIRLSVDSGSTFPVYLASNIPNDSTKTILVPDLPSFYCQVRVESSDDTTIFGVNPGTFEIHTPLTTSLLSSIVFSNVEAGTSRFIGGCGREGCPPFLIADGDSIGTISILGDPSAQTKLTFTVPTTLQNHSGDTISISYDGSSAAVVDQISGAISFLDPRFGTKAYLDYVEGKVIVKVGGFVHIPINAKHDTYTGSMTVVVSYNTCCNSGKTSARTSFAHQSSIEISVYAIVIPPISVDEHYNKNTPTSFKLDEAYPNPFNPNTKIEFSLPRASYVTLKIFNIIGEEVATLASEELQPGTYQRSWNASKFASGVYYYRIQTNSFAETKKLLLLK